MYVQEVFQNTQVLQKKKIKKMSYKCLIPEVTEAHRNWMLEEEKTKKKIFLNLNPNILS